MPPPAVVEVNACRICWDDEDGDWLDPSLAATAAAAAVNGGDDSGASSLALGALMHHVCACRGTNGSVHEGCLVGFLCASVDRSIGRTLTELACPTCKQPYVGRAGRLLAGCAAAVRAARANVDEALRDEAAAADDAHAADERAIAAAEGRVNEATALWKSGAFDEAIERLQAVCAGLGDMGVLRDPLHAPRRAVLQHSTEHNLGLILKEHGDYTVRERPASNPVQPLRILLSPVRLVAWASHTRM